MADWHVIYLLLSQKSVFETLSAALGQVVRVLEVGAGDGRLAHHVSAVLAIHL